MVWIERVTNVGAGPGWFAERREKFNYTRRSEKKFKEIQDILSTDSKRELKEIQDKLIWLTRVSGLFLGYTIVLSGLASVFSLI